MLLIQLFVDTVQIPVVHCDVDSVILCGPVESVPVRFAVTQVNASAASKKELQ